MSDVRVLVRTSARSSLRRERPLLGLMVLFVAAVLICHGVIGAGVSRYARSVEYKSALNLIQLSSVSPSARRQLDDQTLGEVRGVPGVTGVYPWTQVDLSISSPSDWPDPNVNPGPVWGTPIVPGLAPKVLAGSIPPEGLSGDEIALPHSVPGGTLDKLLGKQVQLEYTRVVSAGQGEPARRSFRVVAIIDNSTPGEAGPTPSYVAQDTLTALIRAAGTAGAGPLTYTSAYVRTATPADVPSVQTELSDQGFAVSSVATQLSSLGGLFRVLSWGSWLFAGLLVLICLSIGGAIGSAWVQQRTREMGLLKAIGWSRLRILQALMLQLGLVGLVAAVCGAVLGVLGSVVITAVVAGRHVDVLPVDPWQSPGLLVVLLGVVLVPLCVCLGGLRSAVRAVRIDADDALRDL